MPNTAFNKHLLSKATEIDFSEKKPEVYGTDEPIYFTVPIDAQNISQLLENFSHSAEYKEMQLQYHTLLQALNQWCDQQGILHKEYYLINREEMSVFSLIGERLFVFGDQDVYQNSKVVLFGEGKKALEELLSLLHNHEIPLPLKLQIMETLQQHIVLCADGALTNIIDARNDLKASYTGIMFLIKNIMRSIIQQEALLFVRALYGEIPGNEIHYINAFSDVVARKYGIPDNLDKIILNMDIPIPHLAQFTQKIEKTLTPAVILQALMQSLLSEIATMKTEFNADYFKEKQSIPMERYKELTKAGDILLLRWNEKYGSILPLELSILFQMDEEGLSIIPTPLDEFVFQKTVSREFNKQFLVPGTYELVIPIDDQNKLLINNGLYWVECGTNVRHFSLEQISELQIENIVDFNRLIELMPEARERLIKSPAFAKLGYSARQLLKEHYMPTLEAMLDHYSFTTEPLAFEDFNNITYETTFFLLNKLVDNGLLANFNFRPIWKTVLSAPEKPQMSFINKLYGLGLLSPQLLAESFDGKNIVYALAYNENYFVLKGLYEKGLLTSALLASAPIKGADAGKNSIWWLVKNHNYSIEDQSNNVLHMLYNHLSPELLNAAPLQGPYEGINSLWLLASDGQFSLIENLLAHNRITADMVAKEAGKNSGNYKINALWWMIYYQNTDLLKNILHYHPELITAKMLASAPTTGEYAQVNCLKLLEINGQNELIDLMISHNIIKDAKRPPEWGAEDKIVLSNKPMRATQLNFFSPMRAKYSPEELALFKMGEEDRSSEFVKKPKPWLEGKKKITFELEKPTAPKNTSSPKSK